MDIYPPPDLAIESDITSKTFLSAYEAIGVPELWIYDDGLKIFWWQEGHYKDIMLSRNRVCCFLI